MSAVESAIHAVLSTTAERWQRLANEMPAAALTRRPADSEWSAVECMGHMLDVERIFQSRLAAFLAGEDFPAFDPDTEGSQRSDADVGALVADFTALRKKGLAVLERVSADDLKRQVRHAELGPVTLEQMLNEWAAHDLSHTVQAEEAIMQPFIHGCGPWQKFFAAHVVESRT